MRAFDAHAIETCHVPSLLLMENAGRSATELLVRELLGGRGAGKRVVIVCGTGNNGGDGFVIARQLLLRGADPSVLLAGDPQRTSRDARTNLEAWLGLGRELRVLSETDAVPALGAAVENAAVVVDALFGTGLDRPIDGWLARLVGAMNDARAARFAVDLPSGLDADTGAALGVSVRAHVTATFAHPKLGLLTPHGAELAGRVYVVDIGVPSSLSAQLGASVGLLEPADLARWVIRRRSGAHKNTAGHVAVIAGSPGKVGAPQMVAHGAMRAGAGLATIGTWPESAGAIESHVLELMTARLDRSAIGASLDAILAGKGAVVIGPGFGIGDEARAAVEHVLASFHGPVVIDADALSVFAGRPTAFAGAKNAILTPHPGELAQLLGMTPAEVEADRFGAARDAVEITKAVVVLKGAHTIVASPDAPMAVAPVACAALATAGSGDVLGGVIAAMACALPPFEAACAGVLLHGLAGEAWSRAHAGADRGMLAPEIADMIPHVLAGLLEA
jgi:ADP-dependent NAD(P)H-hydrate dehydratase / NAD(P)H-hydrate epimerase